MSNPHDDFRRVTTRTQEGLASALERIRRNDHLSEGGKRVRIAQAYVDAKDAMTAALGDLEFGVAQQRRALELAAFSPQSGSLTTTQKVAQDASYRDALSRADQLQDQDEATALLQRAGRTGDDLLAQAVAVIAAERMWPSVLDTYAAEHPSHADAVGQLIDLNRTERDPNWQVSRSMHVSLSRPDELAGIPDHDLHTFIGDGAEVTA